MVCVPADTHGWTVCLDSQPMSAGNYRRTGPVSPDWSADHSKSAHILLHAWCILTLHASVTAVGHVDSHCCIQRLLNFMPQTCIASAHMCCPSSAMLIQLR